MIVWVSFNRRQRMRNNLFRNFVVRYLGIDGRIILKWMLAKQVVKTKPGFT